MKHKQFKHKPNTIKTFYNRQLILQHFNLHLNSLKVHIEFTVHIFVLKFSKNVVKTTPSRIFVDSVIS